MQKIFELIKKYPSLPSDWKVGMEVGIGDYRVDHYSPCNGDYKDFYIPKGEVESSPEFWKEIGVFEIVTQDGEIVKEGDTVYILTDNWKIFTRLYSPGMSGILFKGRDNILNYISQNKPVLYYKQLVKLCIFNNEILNSIAELTDKHMEEYYGKKD